MKRIVSCRALILNPENKLLLITHNEINYWYTPGGKWEENESLKECAQREVYEEIGIKIDLEKLVYVHETSGPHKGEMSQYIAFFFFGRIDKPLPKEWEDNGGTYEVITKLFSKDELQNMTVYPELLKDKFWQDMQNDFQHHTVYAYSKPFN